MATELSVLYPAYNEEQDIRSTVARSLEALRCLVSSFEIIIVDDCGRDSTGAIADELARQHPEIRVLHNQRNLGHGASLIRGFREARGEWVLHNAMDYPFDLRDLDKMLPLREQADIVVAVRRQRAGYSFYRKLISVTNVALLRLMFDLKLRDYNFVQLFRKTVWDTVPVEASSTGFLIPSMLFGAHDRGLRIVSVDIDYHPRLHGTATAGHPKVVLASVRELFGYWWRRRKRLAASSK